ncbi:MAG TPA: GNAT family N-acetyltransferase [Solirubrobacterales bacterium]|nr:GNAT family N-acetyltransferase [Solirubrobacterales bacterium]
MPETTPTADPGAPDPRQAELGLRRASANDISALKTVLAEAFYEDPIFAWLMPDDRRRAARLRHFFSIELRHMGPPRGEVLTTNDLAGAVIVMPPGAWRAPIRATLLEGGAFGVHLGRAARLDAAIEWHHTRGVSDPHYYVRDIGVLPRMQGRGIGSCLLRRILERCDREGLPAYLEASSERNAVLYERLGFHLTRELRVSSSPPLRLMLRPPGRER